MGRLEHAAVTDSAGAVVDYCRVYLHVRVGRHGGLVVADKVTAFAEAGSSKDA
jgi:hypothetical protein